MVATCETSGGRVPYNTLALDLGTKTGWCWRSPGGETAGVWNLKPTPRDSPGMLLIRLENQLNEIHQTVEGKRGKLSGLGNHVALVVFEDVNFAVTTYAAQTWGGLYRGLTAWCDRRGIPYAGIKVPTLKKWATGKGNAGKPMMMAACAERLGVATKSDDEADARLLLAYAQEVGV